MKVRCPTCGAVMSLDVLIAHDDAREALIALTGISDDLFKAVLRYLTLFRPAETRCLEARDAGKLTPPLTSHGYLLENITFWSPEKTAGTAVLPSPQPSPAGEVASTKLRSGLGGLMEWSNGGEE